MMIEKKVDSMRAKFKLATVYTGKKNKKGLMYMIEKDTGGSDVGE